MQIRTAIIVLLTIFISLHSRAQVLQETDSIYRLLLHQPKDTSLIMSLNGLISRLSYQNADTALFYSKKQDSISKQAG